MDALLICIGALGLAILLLMAFGAGHGEAIRAVVTDCKTLGGFHVNGKTYRCTEIVKVDSEGAKG